MYGFLADLIVAIHVGYVGFVIVGQVLILLGIALRWQWVRNFAFRLLHLFMIAVVAAESIANFECPLTTWEDFCRTKAHEAVVLQEQTPDGLAQAAEQAFGPLAEPRTFIGRCLDNILFCDWPEQVFLPIYVGFALLVLATFVLAPPRRKCKVAVK